ncbi:ribokinase-like [Bolinopsis microptera]|uniref:ribokinase-like n=1 Tax=Bolinopsis microptera TaxID=2820187 RepID=UPI0030791480
MTASVVVVGSCMTDLISYVPVLPKGGETVHGTKFMVGFGGKGANQAVMAAKLGAKTALVAKLGTDTFGDNYIENLKNVGVDITHVGRVESAASGVATITVDNQAENCIVIVGGANNELDDEAVNQAKSLLASGKVVVFQQEIPLSTNLTALKLIKSLNKDITTIYNAAPATDSLPDELYKLVDIFCVNESEAEKLLGLESVNSVEEASNAAGLLRKKGCKMGMVTLGANGVIYQDGSGENVHVPCPKVKAVDTTGAGDAFIGSLACLLADESLKGRSFQRKVEVACSVASQSVTKLGTQSSYPTSY